MTWIPSPAVRRAGCCRPPFGGSGVLAQCIANAIEEQEENPLVHCTSVETNVWSLQDDPLCRPFFSEAKCFSDGTETFTAIDADGTSYPSIGDLLMAGAVPYSAGATREESVKAEVRNYFIVDPAAGTVVDFVSAVIADQAPATQFPDEAAPVPVTADDVCSWELQMMPCGAALETGEIVPEGADFAFIGGLKAQSDADKPFAGATTDTTFTPPPVAGSIAQFCVSFERKRTVKA